MPDIQRVSLSVDQPIWGQFYTVFPLVLVGTLEEDGTHDLAPKHLAMPMSWQNLFGFVCSPEHATWRNAVRTGAFTVSYVHPDQAVLASLAAAPRSDEGVKPSLSAIQVSPSQVVPGVVVTGCPVQLECTLLRTVDDLGDNSLVIGRVVAAHVDPEAMRGPDHDDCEMVYDHPHLAFLYPDRFALVDLTNHFPFHVGWKR